MFAFHPCGLAIHQSRASVKDMYPDSTRVGILTVRGPIEAGDGKGRTRRDAVI